MSELTHDVRALPKAEAWALLEAQLDSILEGIDDPIAMMATLSSVVHHGFGHLFGKGVCGTAAADCRTVIVPDVNAFAGHISCDSRSRSEIVVPVIGRDGQLLAVLDVDSERLAAFDEVDGGALERLVGRFRR